MMLEEYYPRSHKERMMSKLRMWASENRIKLHGTVKETATEGFMQHGHTRHSDKLYLVDKEGIYTWRGHVKGWRKLN